MWIFGYGSLIWRPAFKYVEVRRARLPGWQRQLWQGSPDHRGTPGDPGRVVTLVENSMDSCVGMVFRIEAHTALATMAALDDRESGGYVRLQVNVTLTETLDTVDALTYYAPPENDNFLGPAPDDQLIRQIQQSHGQSGSNVEYVLRLAEALREYEIEDENIDRLACAVMASGDLAAS